MLTTKSFHSIRWKFLFIFVISIILTALVLLIGQSVGTYIIELPSINPPLKWVINTIGSKPILYTSGFLLFFFFYFWISRPIVYYLREIADSLVEMTKGKLSTTIPVKSADELGTIALNINYVTEEINSYLQQIKEGLNEIAKGNFNTHISVRSDNELGTVAESINLMSAQLYDSLQEERHAEKTKNDLITGVSHDLRTPLTSILGFLELIDKDRYINEVELRYYINIAYDKSLSLKKLIDDLFEYTRINNGMPLHLRELDITGFFRQLADEFVPSMEKAGMIVRIHAPEQPITMRVDGDQLVRAYENLLSNAIKYGNEGKVIDIHILKEDDGQVVVQISNYGNPIPERDLPYMFDRFYRVEQSRSKETGGTGLGLAITKSIVEVHGGEISVTSSRAKTTFETRFPAQS